MMMTILQDFSSLQEITTVHKRIKNNSQTQKKQLPTEHTGQVNVHKKMRGNWSMCNSEGHGCSKSSSGGQFKLAAEMKIVFEWEIVWLNILYLTCNNVL